MPLTLTIGGRLGSYEILAPLGVGGMGEVFRARDTRLGRAIALKVLPAATAEDPDRLARFQREARAVAALNHPNIVTLYSVEEADGIHFLTMELVEGHSLAELTPGNGLPIDRVLIAGTALADALAAAHDKSIVHRDLKPANVMMTNDGRLKVLDFGLAKDIGANDREDATMAAVGHTRVGVVMGTPAYMSPEQLAAGPLDHRTDLFSLGVLLYEMCSGRRPFEGATSIELASAILRDPPRPLNEIRPDVPGELARVIQRCLEKDPQRRIQTAREVGNELREIARSPASVSGSPSKTESSATRANEGFWVAVLPFKCRGDNADLAALADGLSEEIVTGLSRFPYLRVIARGSVSRYANATVDVRVIGKEIGARYVMEGSVRQAGSQLRVAVQLVDAMSGAHLWADTYNRPFQADAIFEVQDDLVPRIVSTVADGNGVLLRSIGDVLRGRDPDKFTSYEAVLRGWSFYTGVALNEHAGVRALLERAVDHAKDYADAWALLSLLYQDEYRNGFSPGPDPLGRAGVAARRAVELGPTNHLAHQALASVLFFKRDLVAFRRAAERSLTLNPMDANSVGYLGCLLAFAGDWRRGIELVDRSIALNPHHPGWFWLPHFYNSYRLRDYPAALDAAVRINMPAYFFAHAAVVAAHGQLGGPEPAREALQQLLALKPDIARTARDEYSRWFVDAAFVEHLLDGLRKAGLAVENEAR